MIPNSLKEVYLFATENKIADNQGRQFFITFLKEDGAPTKNVV